MPRVIAFAAGSAVISLAVFLLLAVGLANRVSFGLLGAAALAAYLRARGKERYAPLKLNRSWRTVGAVIAAAYGALYVVHTLAPEIQPDAVTYHLGLVAEWLRLGGFANRVGFYEVLPLGAETLFAFAFAFGKHSAAKIVHFGFLAATFPLIVHIARRMGLDDHVGVAAALLYGLSPVTGVAGTSAYSDAAAVFFTLSTFCLLLKWWYERDDRLLFWAGLTAGFCYAIKLPGLLIPAVAVAVPLVRKRYRGSLLFAAGAGLVIAPWMMRAATLTGNPLAPLFNDWFPNPYFHVSTERELASNLSSFEGLPVSQILLQVTLRGNILAGLLGPVFLLAPLALLALRRRAGAMFLTAAAVTAIPWFANSGTRFLMPSMAFTALALATALPRPALLIVVGFHAITCWPHILGLYTPPGAWHLRGFPVKAALRLEPEQQYLERTLYHYPVAQLLNRTAKPGDVVLDFGGVPSAYHHAVSLGPWHSAAAERCVAALHLAAVDGPEALYDLRAEWPEQVLSGLRIRQTGAGPHPWSIHEVQLRRGDSIVRPTRLALSASPNLWETRFAFDANLASRWTTWDPVRPGMHFDIEFDAPKPLTGLTLVANRLEYGSRIEIVGRTTQGQWQLLTANPVAVERTPRSLYRLAIQQLKKEGVRYIVTPASGVGYGLFGKAMIERKQDWGVEECGSVRNLVLLRLK